MLRMLAVAFEHMLFSDTRVIELESILSVESDVYLDALKAIVLHIVISYVLNHPGRLDRRTEGRTGRSKDQCRRHRWHTEVGMPLQRHHHKQTHTHTSLYKYALVSMSFR